MTHYHIFYIDVGDHGNLHTEEYVITTNSIDVIRNFLHTHNVDYDNPTHRTYVNKTIPEFDGEHPTYRNPNILGNRDCWVVVKVR